MDENQLKLPTGKIITFNPEQFEGIQKISDWLKNGKGFFTLAGPAGSGKSTMIKKILNNYYSNVVISAPTHQALKVIKNMTNIEGKTLHSLLGLRPDLNLEDFNPNNPQFNPIAIPKINNYDFCLIDEASMINQELFNLIELLTEKSKIKILFIGDSAQLPPVGEEISIVFVRDDIKKYCLTKIERQQDGNPILETCDKLRNNQTLIDGGYQRKTKINELGEGIFFTTDKVKFRKAIIDKYMTNDFHKDSGYVKGLAWTNDTVTKSNEIIRNNIFGKNANIIELNDILMGYRTITDETQKHTIIQNSADYHVIEISDMEENSYGIMGFRVKLREDIGKGLFLFENVFIINANDRDNFHLYGEMHDFFRDMGKSNKKNWKKYYAFRRNNILIKDIVTYRNGQLRNTIDKIKKDVDYGYFLTIHKSQGSTYQHVMVIESDINKNWDIVERNKLRYVAFSRPEKTCTVLTSKLD